MSNNTPSAEAFDEAVRPYHEYLVSESGEVYSTARKVVRKNDRGFAKKQKRLLQRVSDRGYFVVDLVINKKKVRKQVHRLVAEVFLDSSDGDIVNHKNLNKLDNHYTNLEWCTQAHNVQHAWDNDARKVKKKTKQDVIVACENSNSPSEAAKYLGIKSASFYKCLSKYEIEKPVHWNNKYNIKESEIARVMSKETTASQLARLKGCDLTLVLFYIKKYRKGTSWQSIQ